MVDQLYADFMTNPRSYDACRRIWRRALRKVVPQSSTKWRLPWFCERYGNGELIRDSGVMTTAVATDWSRGVSIEQIPTRRDATALYFTLCWVSVPGFMDSPGVRRLALRCTLTHHSQELVATLLKAWVSDNLPEARVMTMAERMGVATMSREEFDIYRRKLQKQRRRFGRS